MGAEGPAERPAFVGLIPAFRTLAQVGPPAGGPGLRIRAQLPRRATHQAEQLVLREGSPAGDAAPAGTPTPGYERSSAACGS